MSCAELGSSVNEQMLETNMKEEPIVAHRIVYEIVSKEGDILRAAQWKETLRSEAVLGGII